MNLIKEKAKTKVKSITKEELQNIMSPKSDKKTKSKTKTVKKTKPSSLVLKKLVKNNQ